jgi:hypothetical protein
MQLVNRTFQILAIMLFAAPFNAYASSWSCSHGNDVREVHVERPTSSPVPCNVVYKKQTEGVEDQILWNATSDDSYCDEKAQGFVAKLESWGWVCTETISDDTGTNMETAETVEAVETVETVTTGNAAEEAGIVKEADSTNSEDTATDTTP